MLGMQAFGIALGRVSVINNALLTDMFHHPDSRQSLAPLSNQLINKDMRGKIMGYQAKDLLKPKAHFEKRKFIGSHGVPTMHTGFKSFSPFIPKLLPKGMKLKAEEELFYKNIMCQGFSAWMMSRPTKRTQVALKKYKENFINKCDSKNVPDIAIQVRTLDNIKSEFNSTVEDCYVSCAVAKARAVQKELHRDVCIFVTSNRVSTTDNVVERLHSLLNSDTDESSSFKFLYHQLASRESQEIMHSGRMVEAGRHVESFPPEEDFSLKEDLMDWFLLVSAVQCSTYSAVQCRAVQCSARIMHVMLAVGIYLQLLLLLLGSLAYMLCCWLFTIYLHSSSCLCHCLQHRQPSSSMLLYVPRIVLFLLSLLLCFSFLYSRAKRFTSLVLTTPPSSPLLGCALAVQSATYSTLCSTTSPPK